MPPRCKVGDDAKLCKPVQIRIVLNLQMSAGDTHMEAVSQLFSCQFHAVQHNTGRALADSVTVQIQTRLIELF